MNKVYLVLLLDKKHATFFILRGQSVERIVEKHQHEYVPQKVKHGDDTWDAPDKIFRHIEDHLHRYLQEVMKEVGDFVGKEYIDGVFIGSHRELFSIVQKHLPKNLQQKAPQYVVIDMKMPFNKQLEKMKKAMHESEEKQAAVSRV